MKTFFLKINPSIYKELEDRLPVLDSLLTLDEKTRAVYFAFDRYCREKSDHFFNITKRELTLLAIIKLISVCDLDTTMLYKLVDSVKNVPYAFLKEELCKYMQTGDKKLK